MQLSRPQALRSLDLCTLRGCSIPSRQAVEARSIERHTRRNSLGVRHERLKIEICVVVPSLVIVHVVRNTRFAAEDGCFFFSFDFFGAGEYTSCWDANVEEGAVVGAAVEVGRLGWEAFGGEVVFEEVLGFCATWRSGEVEGAAVAVVEGCDVVGRGDHVEIEVQLDLVAVGLGESCGVVCAAEEAEFFGRPEIEHEWLQVNSI